MPVAGGPFIQKTGILLEVDAADRTSYPGTGTTWTNQIRPGTFNGTLNNISFNSSDANGALVFTGSNTFVDFGNLGPSLTSSFSFQVAFKPAATASGQPYTILSYASSSATSSITFKLDYTSSNQTVILTAFSNTGSQNIVYSLSSSVTPGTWNIIDGTYGSQVLALSKGGNLVSSVPTTGSTVGYNTNNRLYLGGTFGVSSGIFTGSVAKVTINNADLDVRAISTNFNAFFSRFGLSKTPGLVTDFDAAAFIETAGLNNDTQAVAINTLVLGLKANNLWTKMVAIYPFVGGSAYTHRFNLKNTSLYPMSFAGGINHTSLGVVTTATNATATTGIVPRTALSNISSSAHVSINLNTNSSASVNVIIGNTPNYPAAPEFRQGISMAHGYFGNTSPAATGFSSTVPSIPTRVGAGQGLWVTSRVSDTVSAYRRSTVQDFNVSASGATFSDFYSRNNPIQLLQDYSYGGTAGLIVNCATVGDGLTQTDVDNLYTLLNTYNTILSRL
jgi:hypothetical protein